MPEIDILVHEVRRNQASYANGKGIRQEIYLGGLVLLFILGSNLGGVGPERGLRGEEERGGVRSGPGAARTILLFHIISARPCKQPRVVRTFLKVYTELGSYFWFLQEQIKRHHHQPAGPYRGFPGH